jgi:hypothetical protein
MTRVRHVEVWFIFIVQGAEPGLQCLRISRRLISGYLSATSSTYHRPQCPLSKVGASTRPGPPPRGASAVCSANARTFLLPAPGNHASSFFFNLLHTPTCRAYDIYFESQVIPSKVLKHSSGLDLFLFHVRQLYEPLLPSSSFTTSAIKPSPLGMPSYAIHHISLLRK